MKLTRIGLRLPLALLFAVLAASPAAAEDNGLAQKAQAVLKANCYRCHGQDGAVEGGMNYILDFAKLVHAKKVVPGQPDKSPLYKKIVNNLMPPPDEKPRPGDADREVIRKWIAEGAPTVSVSAKPQAISDADVTRFIVADLEKIEPRSRRFSRYFTIAHLHNAGLGADELQTYRNALAKLINSLSWHPRIAAPVAVDPARTVLRIDLRHYMWDANLWNRVLQEYPYGIFQDTAAAKAVSVATATRLPCVRADWFLATASRAPLYYDLLQTPNQVAELERQLRVDVLVDIQQERVARAGFNGSGVSRNNRILERHDAVHGVYWKTYDFNEIPQNLTDRQNLLPDRRNIFAYPLGPGGLENNFQHAGGEVIYNLPNGLHAFVLVNANGVRLDKAPTAIVSDPKRPDRAVEAGLSCMSCHVRGINFKDDQVRDYVDKNPKAFGRADAEAIKALYVPKDKMRTLMERDAERFRKAVEQTGAKVSTTETISTMVQRYEADLDLPTAAAEIGLTPDELIRKLDESEVLARNFGSLQVDGGTVARQVLIQGFADVVKELHLGILFSSNQTGQPLPDNTGEIDPLESRTSQANSMVFSADGRFALFASADKTVRLWDFDANRELRRFVGHVTSVWSVAVSADGKLALSGGADGSVRLWDVETGREVRRLDGHLGVVTGLAFTPDGKQALSASYDQNVIVWDLKTGKENRRFEGIPYVHCIALAPDGKRALLGGDRVLSLWDIAAGQEIERLEGHTDATVSLTISADGKRALSGSDDQTLRLWDLEQRRVLRVFTGHKGPVKAVAFSPDGKRIVSGGSDTTVRVWDLADGKELGKFTRHADGLLCVAFASDGSRTVSGSRDSDIRFWSLAKLLAPTPNPEPRTVPEAPAVPVQGELKPANVIPVGATIGSLLLAPDRKSLYYLNVSQLKAARIDTETLKRTAVLPLADNTEALLLPRNGQALYGIASVHGHGKRPHEGLIQVIDPATLKLRKSFKIEADPYDGAATDDGILYVSGGSGDWTDVAIVDVKQETIVGRFGGVWNRSFLRLAPNQDRLFFSSQGVTPGTLDTLFLTGKRDEKPLQYRAPVQEGRPLGGEFVVSPDGKFLLCKTGTLLKLAAERDADLEATAFLGPFLAAVVDPERGAAFVLTAEGWLKHYGYPDFQLRGRYRLGVVGYQAVLDGAQGRLYVGGFDPQALAQRPSGKGLGDIYVFDVKQLVGSRK